MIKRYAKALALAPLLLVLGFALGQAPVVRADYDNIRPATFYTTISAQTIGAGLSFTQGQAGSNTRPFLVLPRSVTQAVQVQGIGTSPNYKVELLVTLDGANYAKPEIGGDLGTFTDQNLHIIPLFGPLCVGHELKITELGGANSIAITAGEISQ